MSSHGDRPEINDDSVVIPSSGLNGRRSAAARIRAGEGVVQNSNLFSPGVHRGEGGVGIPSICFPLASIEGKEGYGIPSNCSQGGVGTLSSCSLLASIEGKEGSAYFQVVPPWRP